MMSQHHIYRFDDFEVDRESFMLRRVGREVHLEPVVLNLLIYLICNRDRLVTRQELMDTVWGDTVISESALSKAAARLRKALDDDAVDPRYIQTVRSQGYRFIADVEERESSDSPFRKTTRVTARGGLLAGAAAIVLLVLAASFWARAPEHGASQTNGVESLAVLPLRNLTGDPGQDYYVDGLHDLLITELSLIPGIRVTSRQSTRRYRDSELPTADISEELGVDALVEGSLLREGSKVEVTLQLIDGRSDKHLWAGRYTGETPFVFDLIADVAEAIGAEIGAAKMSSGIGRLGHKQIGPVDPRAIDAYAMGTIHLDGFTRDGIRLAIEQLETAVEIEPKFALAWGQLAAAHAMQALFGSARPRESIEKCRVAALQGIEADSQVAIGHSGLGWARMWTGDFDGACESFEEALRLDPSAPYAIHGKADCLMLDGRIDESLARLRELVTISPFSAMHNMPLSSHLYMARRFDAAIAAGNAMLTRAPQFPIHGFLAKMYWQQGRFDKALNEERQDLEWRGDVALLAALEAGLEADGPVGAMRAMAEALVARAGESYADPYKVGETFARAGMVDEALYWLDKAVEHGSYENMYIPFRPDFDVLHDDPRYQDLVQRIYRQRTPRIMQISQRP